MYNNTNQYTDCDGRYTYTKLFFTPLHTIKHIPHIRPTMKKVCLYSILCSLEIPFINRFESKIDTRSRGFSFSLYMSLSYISIYLNKLLIVT